MLDKNKEKKKRKERRKPMLRPARFTKKPLTHERKGENETMTNIKLRDAERILKKNGWTRAYISGDHYHYTNGKRRLQLPFHVNRGYECNARIWKARCKEYNIHD